MVHIMTQSEPEATCGDCLAFIIEKREDDVTLGRCQFRPELRTIPDTFNVCSKFHIRQSRRGKVLVPKKTPVARPRGSAKANDDTNPWPKYATLKNPTTGNTEGEITVDRDGLKQVLREILEEETMYGFVELGKKWQGGTVLMKPANSELQPKEIAIDTFFHKIVMVRDRLRVLEAKLNSCQDLDQTSKIELQQYVSKAYGSLTTFNVLFQNKEDQFTSK